MPKTIAQPRYEPMTWEGEQYVVLANPPLDILERVRTDLAGVLREVIREHPYVDEKGKPVDLARVDVKELGNVLDAWSTWLRDLPKA